MILLQIKEKNEQKKMLQVIKVLRKINKIILRLNYKLKNLKAG
jgi:hypothetical protein